MMSQTVPLTPRTVPPAAAAPVEARGGGEGPRRRPGCPTSVCGCAASLYGCTASICGCTTSIYGCISHLYMDAVPDFLGGEMRLFMDAVFLSVHGGVGELTRAGAAQERVVVLAEQMLDKVSRAPVNRGTVSVNRGTAPINRGTASVNRGTVPINRGTASVNRCTAPINRGAAPIDTGVASVNRGTVPINRGSAPANRGRAPANRGTAPINRIFVCQQTKIWRQCTNL